MDHTDAPDPAPASTTSAVDLAAAVRSGATTARAEAEAALDRAARIGGPLNAFTVLLPDRARAEADDRDRVVGSEAGTGPLHGVPVAIKEELDVAGAVTTFGGRANVTPAVADGEVVRRLTAAGAVVVGKTTMPEFGAFPYTESVATGITRNPWDPTRSPGGSSGGTAAAVAAGVVPVGMGGDGGGSIRIPAAFCGLFGLKPQRGRVTSAPHPHLWWALGTAGPLSRTVLDSAVVHEAIRGSTDVDRWHAGEAGSFVDAARREPGRLRVAWTTAAASPGVRTHPAHVRAVEETARLLARLGHDVRPLESRLPDPTLAFVPQFLAGVRHEAGLVEHPERLERRTRETARLGTWVTQGVVDAALRATERVAARAAEVFAGGVDVLLTPTTAHRPPPVGRLDGVGTLRAGLRSTPAIAFTALWNVAGNPAAAVPCGLGDDGLPLSVQLVGPADGEPVLLSLSAQLEAARPWPLLAASGA